ncbi:hypothetical protein ES703_119481 [subsurface metagenome]
MEGATRMSLLLKGGISKLSELEIDADKDWDGKGISNIKEIAETMAIGHLVQFDGTKLVKLQPGVANLVLTSEGPGKVIVWAPGGTYFHRYFPVSIDLSHAEAKVTPDKSYDKDAPITTWNRQTYGDAPADYIKRLTPSVALVDAEVVVTPDKTHNENAPVATAITWKKSVDGAVADDGGAQTDETSEAQDDTIDDMTLLPVCTNGGLAVGDAYYFGFAYKFDRLWLNISTAGVGNYAIAFEYWDGDSWELLADLVDPTSDFTVAGLNKIDFTRPGDWALTIVQAMNLYWMRARVTDVVAYTAQPLGAQAWCEVFI